MADIKIQVVRGETPSDHVDFRSPNGLGAKDGDFHTTAVEFTNVDDKTVEYVLDMAPVVNEFFDQLSALQPPQLSAVASALGVEGEGPFRIQVRVYDE
jgi:hypothetical protein